MPYKAINEHNEAHNCNGWPNFFFPITTIQAAFGRLRNQHAYFAKQLRGENNAKTVWAFNKIDPSPLGRKERKQISNVRWNPPRVIIINKSWNESSIFTKEWARSSVLCTEPVCDCRFFELVIVLLKKFSPPSLGDWKKINLSLSWMVRTTTVSVYCFHIILNRELR